MTDNVTPLRPSLAPTAVGSQLAESMAQTVKQFEAEGDVPTGAVWVVFDDKGAFRTGWDSNNSALPATALLGIAMRALSRD